MCRPPGRCPLGAHVFRWRRSALATGYPLRASGATYYHHRMPSTHTSLHYHLVFSTRERAPLIRTDIRERVHGYLGGVIRGLEGTPLEVGGVADHVHLVVGLKPTHVVANVMRVLKGDSSKWILAELGVPNFAWQEGYGAFTVSRSNVDAVREYVRNQEEHHRKRTFQEEYLEFLQKMEIEFDERYLW
jgi:putative transposase